MSDNPYQTPEFIDQPGTPVRLMRGRRILVVMAAIVLGVAAWEIVNHNLFNGWESFPMQLIRVVVSLVLIWLIWSGRPWARFLLASYSGFIIYSNLELVSRLPDMMSNGQTGNVMLVVFLFGGYIVVCALSCFSPAITALMNFRRDERELA